MRTIGSFVTVHGQYPGVIEREQPNHWVVSYMKHGVRFVQRVPKTSVTNRKKEEIE